MNIKNLSILCFIVVGVLVLQACKSEEKCEDYVRVTIRTLPGKSFPTGSYVFYAVPEGGHPMSIDCTLADLETTTLCNPPNWEEWWVKFENGQWVFSMPGVWTGDPTVAAPSVIYIKVELDDVTILSYDLKPDYEVYEPDGAQYFDEYCYKAEHTLDATGI